ncbi:hypothetical protein EGW08_008268, partial [Elysia chlorotica]
MGLLFDLLDLFAELCDIFVQVCTELVDVGVTLSQSLVYGITHCGDVGVQGLPHLVCYEVHVGHGHLELADELVHLLDHHGLSVQ